MIWQITKLCKMIVKIPWKLRHQESLNVLNLTLLFGSLSNWFQKVGPLNTKAHLPSVLWNLGIFIFIWIECLVTTLVSSTLSKNKSNPVLLSVYMFLWHKQPIYNCRLSASFMMLSLLCMVSTLARLPSLAIVQHARFWTICSLSNSSFAAHVQITSP